MSSLWSGRCSVLMSSWLTSALYPLLSCVVIDAKHQLARTTDFQHLEEPDLLWTGVILADKAQKDCQERELKDRDFLLDLTILMGLYDNKVTNSFIEKSMRYTAMPYSLLYDHVVSLENKVTHCYPFS